METPKYSTDPQEQEKDRNIFKKPFEALAGHTVQDDQKEDDDDDWEFELNDDEEQEEKDVP